MTTLLIRISGNAFDEPGLVQKDTVGRSTTDYELQWVVGRGETVIAAGEATGLTLRAQLQSLEVEVLERATTVLVIPTEQVLLLSCQVPGRNSGQIRQALPYALEEYLASDIEDMHIAADSIKPGQPIHSALIAHDQIKAWRAWLTNCQIVADAIISEAQLGTITDACTVFLAAEQATAIHEQSSATVEREEVVGVLENLAINRLVTVGETLSKIESSQLDAAIAVEHHANVPAFLFQQYAIYKPINLLQGPYAVENRKTGTRKDLTTLAKLAAIWCLIYVAGLGAQGMWSASQADRLATDNRDQYVELFPHDSVPITTAQLRRRLEGKLRVQGQPLAAGSIGFVQLLGDSASAFGTTGKVESLSYLQDKEEMTVELELKGYEQVDQIQAQLKKRGIEIEVVSAGSIDGGISARLRANYAK